MEEKTIYYTKEQMEAEHAILASKGIKFISPNLDLSTPMRIEMVDFNTLFGVIYLAINRMTGKIYVGQTKEKPWRERIKTHRDKAKYSNYYFANAIKKYGIEMFAFHELDGARDQEELDAKEVFWIKAYDLMNKEKGYNLTEGGQRGKRAKHANRNVGRIMSKEQKELLAASHGGRKKKDPEHDFRRGVRVSIKTEFPATSVRCVETGQMFESVNAAARFMNVTNANFARVWKNPESTICGLHWEKIDSSMLDVKDRSVSTKSGRKILCIETGKIYLSITDAARDHRVHSSQFAKAWKDPEYTIGGFHWRKLSKEEILCLKNHSSSG